MPFPLFDNCSPSLLILHTIVPKKNCLFVPIFLINSAHKSLIIFQSFPVISLAVFVCSLLHWAVCLPSQSPVLFPVLMNSWILLFLYKCWICLITPPSLWGLPIGFIHGCIISSASSFFLHKEKEPLRQQASPEPQIINLNITYLPALLPTGLCKTQLNLSPLNSTLQYIKRKFFKRDDKAQAELQSRRLGAFPSTL